MSYQVIARKYRPQRFSEVVGQEHVTRTLSQAIEHDRIAHAYLFCGPRGTGKTTIARIFAKCLNCTGGPKVDFDDSDPRCVEISQGRSLDVLEIDGASNNGVEQVRELRETCRYAPASSKFKIYIIDEVHMLSAAAFNALLKTLEEPPEHVKFMFATTDPEKVLPTILSRCQRFDLRRIPAALISKHLALIAEKEGVEVDPAALHAIARGAEGGMRDAESTLDQLISFCGRKIQEADVLSMFGLAAQGQLLALVDAILNSNVEAALRELNDLATKGKDLGRLMSDLLSHVRNLLIYQVSNSDITMLEVSEAEIAALQSQSGRVSSEVLTRVLDVLADTELKMRNAASRKIVMEVGILKAIEARNSISLDSVLKQLQALREGSGAASAPSSAAAPTRQASPASTSTAHGTATPSLSSALREEPAPQPVLAASSGTEQDIAALWTAALAGVSPLVLATLKGAFPVSFSNRVLTIGFPPEMEAQIPLVDTPRNIGLMQAKLKEAGWDGVQIKFVKARPSAGQAVQPQAPRTSSPPVQPEPSKQSQAAPAPAEKPQGTGSARKAELPPLPGKEKPAAPALFNKEDFKNDPLIKKALEVFRGQIVDVRS